MGDIPTGAQITAILGVMVPIILIIVVGVAYYLKKRLEHKQIMAAIEKGVPLSELVQHKPRLTVPTGPAWIRYLSGGILVLFIAFGFLLGGPFRVGDAPFYTTGVFVAFSLLGVAVSLIIRGLLYRKYYLKSQSANQNDTLPNKTSA